MTLWRESVSLKDLLLDKAQEYELNHHCPSVQNLLNELEANLEEDACGKGHLHLQLLIKRCSNPHYGEYLLFQGNIEGVYYTPCVRCLIPARCPLNMDFSACFLPEHHRDKEEYQEATSIYIDGEERELYFHRNGTANLQETLHENIFINVDPLPLHHPDCRGICPVCGANLNTTSCPHSGT